MQTLMRFLVVSPFVVLREAPRHAFLTVPAGSIIEADHEPIRRLAGGFIESKN